MRVQLLALLIAMFATPVLASGGCTQPDLGPDIFCGTYRAAPKTSFNEGADGTFAAPEVFADLKALRASLTDDQTMRSANSFSMPGPASRLPDEQRNVELHAYIVAVQPGEGDHDFHVIISDQPLGTPGAVFMNVEVSGRPRDGVNDADFVRARQEIASLVPEVASGGSGYRKISDARYVLLRGSLYFDGDHQPGCPKGPGPGYAKPLTVWEIHPVYHIEAAATPAAAALVLRTPEVLHAGDAQPPPRRSRASAWGASAGVCLA